ncbi:MAG: ABC transporter ATP-binding protein/permease, partial [Chloroflexi bacterium]|nr:ABC transporter ATP-binding protein/permease [Chloroflexota bacterium]
CKGDGRFLALLKGGHRRVSIVGPDLAIRRVHPAVVRDALCHDVEAPFIAQTDRFLTGAGVPEHRRSRVGKAILRAQLSPFRIRGCWLLRPSPGASLWLQARRARLPRTLFMLIGGNIVLQVLTLLAWTVIGWGALTGHFDWGWLWAWALLLFTTIPFQMLITQAQSQLAINAGGLFKQRLLHGTLQLTPEEIRHQGAGQFLGRVMESEAVESLALGGGFMVILAVIQLGAAAVLLALGSGGWFHVLLLLSWLVVAFVLCWLYIRRMRAWSESYREMTNDLVERMIGHRTRLAQEDRQHWHDEEDHFLARHQGVGKRVDAIVMQLSALIPRGWMILGLTGISYTFVVARGSPAELVTSLGGMIFALQALTSLVTGVKSLAAAVMAWDQVAPLFRAATRSQHERLGTEPALVLSALSDTFERGQPMMMAREVDFRYRDRGRLVLQACDLQIRKGDRLLLEGPSGGGKSTLAALLAGLRVPESGLLLLWGFDRQTMGDVAWRRRVVVAPQFHENHVLTGTLAFNLLMGRRWPPMPEDLVEAETICRELGLGDLLDRMPAGFQQMLGESGWQLSHGERSRLYIARAILQKADLVILDESFGALDPENLRRAMRCVLDRAPTLLVIAHP